MESIMNRNDRRKFEREAVQNFDQTLINIHVNVQSTYLYVLKEKFGFTHEQIDKVAEEAGNVMNRIAKGDLSFEEIREELSKKEEKKGKKKTNKKEEKDSEDTSK